MQKLTSYAAGSWHEGTGEGVQIHNPTSGEAIALVDSTGLDFQAILDHAHGVGGPALRALSFAERGGLLKALSAAIHEHREELIEISIKNAGSTRGDAKFDIDGATGTLAAYAHFAKSIEGERFINDGEMEQLGRTKRFAGRHLFVPREGASLHINAFNFPAWGMCEKIACSILAGVPVIEKPGTPTALPAWRTAEIIVNSGVLPEGAFQFICGSTGDLVDRLGAQDCMAFTGSAWTGAMLKGNENLVKKNVRVNIEADSLNAAVLAPDVESDSETYALFLRNISTDMTQKTGQKCTATRRILVPADRIEEVKADLVAELGRIKIGDPTVRENRMGPLSSPRQFADVQDGIKRFQELCDTACGGAEPMQETGCFIAPTLLVAKDPEAELLHSEEVFGPVATMMAYDGSAEEAARLVSKGGGGLVTSAYSSDNDWTVSYVLGVAPWHGRVWLANERSAEQSLPPGMVMPQMVHGGPGRAGGGEELGGLRGLDFYMQRIAVQGFGGLLKDAFASKAAAETSA